MKIWGIIRKKQKIVSECLLDWEHEPEYNEAHWLSVVDTVCQKLSLSRPILMEKHMRELNRFSRTIFLPSDFMEEVSFDRFEIELFEEKEILT